MNCALANPPAANPDLIYLRETNPSALPILLATMALAIILPHALVRRAEKLARRADARRSGSRGLPAKYDSRANLRKHRAVCARSPAFFRASRFLIPSCARKNPAAGALSDTHY